MPQDQSLHNENEVYVELLCGHLGWFVDRLREIPPDKWEWQPAVPAPSARMLAEHAWQWLVCDRQHLSEPDCTRHSPIPDPPAEQAAMCDILIEESNRWREMIMGFSPEELDRQGKQFYLRAVNTRWFLMHMIQNVIYKHGEFATLYFALGLDGTEPYTAPYPNEIYQQTNELLGSPFIKAAIDNDIPTLQECIDRGQDINESSPTGSTALLWAAHQGNEQTARFLLEKGADPNFANQYGGTALKLAQFGEHTTIIEMLKQAGAKE